MPAFLAAAGFLALGLFLALFAWVGATCCGKPPPPDGEVEQIIVAGGATPLLFDAAERHKLSPTAKRLLA
jgi:hypothetical protein